MNPDPAPLRNELTRFLTLALTRTTSSMAFQMLTVAVGWQVYHVTSSAFALGLVGLAQFVPIVCLTLVAGHVADRFDRRRIVIVGLLIESVAALMLALGLLGGWLSTPLIYLLVMIGSSARSFEAPTLTTLLPAIVSRERLSRATAWLVTGNQSAQIIGPALGGVMYAFKPVAAYSAVAGLFLGGALLMMQLKFTARPASREPLTLRSLFSGIDFIRRTPIMLGTISLDLFAVLLGGATALLPIFARDILHTGPWGLGMLRSAPAVGSVVMLLVLARRPLDGPIGKILFGALIVFGLATVMFGLSPSLPLSLFALLVLGGADAVSVVIRNTLVQLRTPDEMLGRVSAINTLFVGTSNQLGEFESGATASLMGAVPATVVGGIGTIVVALLWMRWFPTLRKMRSLDGSSERAAAAEALEEDAENPVPVDMQKPVQQ